MSTLSAAGLLSILAVSVDARGSTTQDAGVEPNSVPPDVDGPAGDDALDSSLTLDLEPPSDWRFFIGLYGWLSGIEGDVVTAGVRDGIDISVDEILENTDGAFFLYTEVRWRKLFVTFDGTWADLSSSESDPLLDLDVRVEKRQFEMRLGYELLRNDLDGSSSDEHDPWRREVLVDVFVGARYSSTETTITTRFFDGSMVRSTNDDERWDPILGARVLCDLSKRWFISARGDVGGFSIGNAAELTWQLEGAVGFRLSPMFSLLAGYRAIGTDTVTGSGLSRNGVDLVQHGPFIGLGLSF